MWDNLAFSANIVLPSFILIMVGRLITLSKVATHAEMDKIGKLTFTYVLSTKIFIDVAESDPANFSNQSMVLFIFLMVVALFVLIWFVAAHTLRRKESVGSFVQSSFRCSFTVLGMSMIDSFAGAEGVARCALLLAMTAVVFNILASIALTKPESGSKKALVKKTLRNIVTNPLIIASVLGLVCSLTGFKFPTVIYSPVRSFANMAAPLSLLCIGSSLNFSRVRSSFKYSLIAACIKTFGEALIAVPVAAALGFRGFELMVIVIFFTAANPSANYVMALASDADSDLAATAIVLSTILCLFTTMAGITAVRALGLV